MIFKNKKTNKNKFSCPVCGARNKLDFFEKIYNKSNDVVDIFICRQCLAIVNFNAFLNGLQNLENIKAIQNDIGYFEYYNIDKMSTAEIWDKVRIQKGILDYYLKNSGENYVGDKVFCEIGAGVGFLSYYASTIFGKVYACDLSLSPIEKLVEKIGKPTNLILIENTLDITEKVDVICFWHTLEHIPDCFRSLKRYKTLIKGGGHIFFQSPLYKKEYVEESHYHFFNAYSINAMMSKLGFKVVTLDFDLNNNFISCLGKLK